MNKAQTALASARILLDAGDTDGATNRAYYAMFDAAIAALSWAGVVGEQSPPKTHGGLIASFGQNLVRTDKLPSEFGRALNRVQELRLTADYLAEPVPLDKAKSAIEEVDRSSLLYPRCCFNRNRRPPERCTKEKRCR
jgi:uncharacterized protein (UPF0332 family)